MGYESRSIYTDNLKEALSIERPTKLTHNPSIVRQNRQGNELSGILLSNHLVYNDPKTGRVLLVGS